MQTPALLLAFGVFTSVALARVDPTNPRLQTVAGYVLASTLLVAVAIVSGTPWGLLYVPTASGLASLCVYLARRLEQ